MSMIVVSLTDCPPKLRGDLSKWLVEINAGVYVGKLGARVRDELWDRICEHLAHGKATMVYSANNEQGMEFRVHNTTWIPADLDGIKLIRRPLPTRSTQEAPQIGTSKASQFLKSRRIQAAKQNQERSEGYIVVDLETTGLSPQNDEIIELGALHIVDGAEKNQLSILVKPQKAVPSEIQHLTGITSDLLTKEGVLLHDAIDQVRAFIGNYKLVYHNAGFDGAFLHCAFEQVGLEPPTNRYEDTMILAKRQLDDVDNYKLETIAQHYGYPDIQHHRAIEDCKMTWFIYEKLIK